MKNLLLLLLSFVLSASMTPSFCQSFIVEPANSPVVVNGYADEADIVADVVISNNTGQAINFKWVRTVNTLPENWESLVCDNVTCWSPAKSSNFYELGAGENTIMNLHFKPYNTPGIGNVEVVVFAVEDSAATRTVITYQANAVVVGINTPYPKNTLSIYPNPARNFLNVSYSTLDDISRIEVYSVIGTRVGTYYPVAGTSSYRIDSNTFNSGMYFISLYNRQNKHISTKVFSKID